MKKLLLLLTVLFGMTLNAQVETEITNYLNLECNVSVCQDIQLGACDGDVNSDGTPYQFTDYQVYYVTEDTFIEYNHTLLRNCRLEARNGANIINVNNSFTIDTSCDVPELGHITDLVFLGAVEGRLYNSLEEYEQTLSISQYELLGHKPIKIEYFDMLGKSIKDIQFASKGVYIQRNTYENNIIKSDKISEK